MDFSIFDHKEHINALTWLGHKNWFSYNDLIEQRAISAKPYKLLIKPNKNIEIKPHDIVVNEKEFNRHPPNMWKVLREIFNVLEHDVIGTLWYNTLSKALADGPKIFKPTEMQCEALENAEARYSFKDYKQPFPVITIQIPEDYRNQLKNKYKIDESPKYVIVNHDDKNKFISVSAFYDKNNIITHITPDRTEYKTIEDSITKNRIRRQDSENKINKNEFNAAENVQRLSINFAMMMSLYTVKIVGPIDTTNYKIWQQESMGNRGGIPTNRAIIARQNLLTAMQIIQFDQSVEFYDEIEENIEVAKGVDIEKLHRSPKSHWRRGHFAMQPCGIGRRERKMIFRKPTLIRAKYFLGEVKNTSVTYVIHPGEQ